MINKTELRIGNKVYVNDAIAEVCGIGESDVSCRFQFGNTIVLGRLSFEEIRPIELSPSILEACGFEKDRNGWLLPGTQFSLTEQFYPCWLDRMLWTQDLPEFKDLSLKHLHQLQNIFYWLTGGTELSINLEKVKV